MPLFASLLVGLADLVDDCPSLLSWCSASYGSLSGRIALHAGMPSAYESTWSGRRLLTLLPAPEGYRTTIVPLSNGYGRLNSILQAQASEPHATMKSISECFE
jgi:hypothetical protein